jgi:hypothetical protein
MFKCRCSAIGQIMTNPRSKSELLSETTKQYLHEWIIANKYNRVKEITSKYLTKGIECEKESIALMNDVLFPFESLVKNEMPFENDYLTGTPDVLFSNEIFEIKTSWDLFTFPFFDKEADKKYIWQVQGYMALTGAKKATIAYCLVNTPESQINDEIRRFTWKNDFIELPQEMEDFLRSRMIFDDIPAKERIKTFEITRDEEAIESIYKRVMECRQYVNSI